MITDNKKLVQAVYAAFQQRDLSELSKLIAPDVQISQSAQLPWGGSYQGLAGLTQFFGTLVQHIDSNVELDNLIDAGEHIIAVGRTSGTVLKNRAPFDVPVVHVWGLKDGLVVSFQPYIDVPSMLRSLNA